MGSHNEVGPPKEDSSFPLSARLAVLTGGALLRALAATWRFDVRNESALLDLERQKLGFIWSLWHGELLPLLWRHRNRGVFILISEHRDGEMVARVATSLGYGLIRGSTTRGGNRALLALVRVLRGGGSVAVTPDGPRGPAHSFAPGALIAAHRAEAPILTVRAHCERAWRLRSWDRFMIPKPFARVVVTYGGPAYVRARDSRDAAAQTEQYGELMEKGAAFDD